MTASNFPRIYGQVTAAETYEGENTVLWLQVARYLVKSRKEKQGGKSVTYLVASEGGQQQQQQPSSPKSTDRLVGLVSLFERVAAGLVDVAVEELDAGERRGLAAHDAWNNAAVSLIRAAQAHARYLIADCYVRSVSSGEEAATFSAPVRQVLSQLCHLFLLHWLMERSGDFVLFGGLSKQQILEGQSTFVSLLGAIRPQAVNLVDAFDLRDEVLNSTLGCWDGNVYQRLFDEAQKSPLNQSAVHQSSYQQSLKPLFKSNL